MEQSSKDIKFRDVIETTFRLICKYGVDRITISQVANYSKVSRGWIYKYIDNNIEGVITFCLNVYAQEFSQLGDIKISTNVQELEDSIISFTDSMFNKVDVNPGIINLYFSQRLGNNIVSKVIIEEEEKYLNHLTTSVSKSINTEAEDASNKAKIIHYMRMGLMLQYVTLTDSKEEFKSESLKSLAKHIQSLA